MKKRLAIGLKVGILFMLSILVTPALSLAASVAEQENSTVSSNGDLATAEVIEIGDEISGVASNFGKGAIDYDFYKIQLSETGKLDVDLTSFIEYSDFAIYDEQGNQLTRSKEMGYDSSIKQLHKTFTTYLVKGTYYIRITGRFDNSSLFGSYKFTTAFTSSHVNNSEQNTEFNSADKIEFSKIYNCQCSINNQVGYYQFTVDTKGNYKLNMDSSLERTYFALYKQNGDFVTDEEIWQNSDIKKGKLDKIYNLEEGTYVIRLTGYAQYNDHTGTYSFKVSPLVSSIQVNKTSISLKTGKTVQLQATVFPSIAENQKVIWKSSKSSIATVDSNGKVKAKKKGTTYITCTSSDGSGTSVKIKVTVK